MTEALKHDISDKSDSRSGKKKKGLEKWQRYQSQNQSQRKWNKPIIQSGDTGVFVTCDRGREPKANDEAVDLFSQYVDSSQLDESDANDDNDDDGDDIEAQIKKEVEGMKPAAKRANNAPFQVIKLDVQCVSFIKVNRDIDPVPLVHRICADAEAKPEQVRCRWIRRMTPITQTRKVLGGGLEELAALVLKPYFHSDGPPKKYAIRPTIRQNQEFNRDKVIKLVADAVGPQHTVDLTNYDHIILVDVIRNICGMSVAGSDYDRLKRYNPAEIYNPTPKPPAPKIVEAKEEEAATAVPNQ